MALYLQLPNLQISIIDNFKKTWHYKFVLSSATSATEIDKSKNKKLYSQAQKSNFNKASTDSEESEEGKVNTIYYIKI